MEKMITKKMLCPSLNIHAIVVVLVSMMLVMSFRPVLGISSGVLENTKVKCIEMEKQALLKFKDELIDEHNRLAAWGTEDDQIDCCRWTGVRCDNQTSHVVVLDLRGPSHDDGYSPLAPLRGKISLSLIKLQNLRYLDLSLNDFGLNPIPEFIGSLRELTYLNLSNANFGETFPHQLGNLSMLRQLDLSSNKFYGPIPLLPPSIIQLDLSRNYFSGSISSLCNTDGSLNFLDLSNNMLSGQFPNCSNMLTGLSILNLANNGFFGKIPNPIGSKILEILHLRNNNFSGEIPTSMRNCPLLLIFDLGQNQMSGEIPSWLGDTFFNLIVLSLESNEFQGRIPLSICHLKYIQILDLSKNKLYGSIPKCLDNLTSMNQENSSMPTITVGMVYNNNAEVGGYSHDSNAFITWKGIPTEYRRTLRLVKLIDLSSNNLIGEIPTEITSLVGLLGLNLSRNNLTGYIPANLGREHLLNFLDLSRNHLLGSIPTSLSQLSHLGVLDLSYNNLSGRIPFTTQLQTFNDSAYIGNSELCGLPLAKACPTAAMPPYNDAEDEEHGDTIITTEFFFSSGLGFSFGFSGIVGSLLLSRSFRYAFIESLNSIEDWIYVRNALIKARLRKTAEKWGTRFWSGIGAGF